MRGKALHWVRAYLKPGPTTTTVTVHSLGDTAAMARQVRDELRKRGQDPAT